MKLTGQCKEDFEKCYEDKYGVLPEDFSNECTFYELDDNMQYGVYVDFFDSVGIHVSMVYSMTANTEVNMKEEYRYSIIFFDKIDTSICSISFTESSRQEARAKAIEKANEIYNAK